jgi:hypothetical protein
MFLATSKTHALLPQDSFLGACKAIGDLDAAASDCVKAALAAHGYNQPYKQNGAAARPESG